MESLENLLKLNWHHLQSEESCMTAVWEVPNLSTGFQEMHDWHALRSIWVGQLNIGIRNAVQGWKHRQHSKSDWPELCGTEAWWRFIRNVRFQPISIQHLLRFGGALWLGQSSYCWRCDDHNHILWCFKKYFHMQKNCSTDHGWIRWTLHLTVPPKNQQADGSSPCKIAQLARSVFRS